MLGASAATHKGARITVTGAQAKLNGQLTITANRITIDSHSFLSQPPGGQSGPMNVAVPPQHDLTEDYDREDLGRTRSLRVACRRRLEVLMPLRLHSADLLQLRHPAETGRLGLQLIKRLHLQSQRRLLLGQPLLKRLYLSRIADGLSRCPVRPESCARSMFFSQP